MSWLLLLVLAQGTHELCRQCHTEAASDVESHPHFKKGVSCDSCHGASEKHRLATGHAPPDRIATREQVPPLCGACHPSERKSYDTSRHAAVLQAGEKSAQCTTCHGNHALKSVKAIQTTCERCHATRPAACTPTARCSTCHEVHRFAKP